MKKPVLFFTCADISNFDYAVMMLNSLVKFHKPGDVDILLLTNEKDQKRLEQLPKRVEVKDLTPYLEDKQFFYRQKPLIMEEYIKEYELVVGLDSDQIITGDLDYIINTKDYDVGTVLNFNRVDPKMYGYVQGWGILPVEYFNCGMVAVRSEKFVHHWKVLCFTPQFDRMQYKEQDLLNVLCYYGNYNVRCFDHMDGVAKYYAWHGLIAKGELVKAELREDKLFIPQGADNFPDRDVEVKVIHAAGGNQPNKMNYKTWVNDEISKRLDYLTSNTVK